MPPEAQISPWVILLVPLLLFYYYNIIHCLLILMFLISFLSPATGCSSGLGCLSGRIAMLRSPKALPQEVMQYHTFATTTGCCIVIR